jgi:hypothetical protein
MLLAILLLTTSNGPAVPETSLQLSKGPSLVMGDNPQLRRNSRRQLIFR